MSREKLYRMEVYWVNGTDGPNEPGSKIVNLHAPLKEMLPMFESCLEQLGRHKLLVVVKP